MLKRRLSSRLGRDSGHFAEVIIREILSLPFFNGSQNETRYEFRLVTFGVISRRPAAGWTSHPVLAEICRRDEWIDFTNDDPVLFELGARRETGSQEAHVSTTSKRCTEERS